MINLLKETVVAYELRMERAGVSASERREYMKWVRYYLDFCSKHGHAPRNEASLEPFLAKLASKKQSAAQKQQASDAVRLLLTRGGGIGVERKVPKPCTSDLQRNDLSGGKQTRKASVVQESSDADKYEEALHIERCVSSGSSWEKEYRDLKGAIRMRNFSDETLKAYRIWVRKFQAFVKSKSPAELDGEDTKRFLTDLAVNRGVAGATQNQAFNALLFFYRHVLGREFGKLDGVVRAKRRPYVPVVLSRREVNVVLGQLAAPYHLVGSLLYGCGLRLKECLELRVQCFNLDAMLLTVHDGKGQKDRTVPLPKSVAEEIETQMRMVRRVHEADLAAGYAGTFLPKKLEVKYKNAPREFIWQWFFPAATLTRISGLNEKRRYHLHDSHVQDAVKTAATKAGLTKRVTPHTLRHTFASHLLLANYDLQTIQRLLGHSDIKTTMIYLQTVPSITLKEAKSPMDLADSLFA